jgi:hypothetical protein
VPGGLYRVLTADNRDGIAEQPLAPRNVIELAYRLHSAHACQGAHVAVYVRRRCSILLLLS